MFRRNKGDQKESAIPPPAANALPREEWRNFIEAAYRGILGRAPDRQGVDFALEKLEHGWTATELLHELQNSEEFELKLGRPAALAERELQAFVAADFDEFSAGLQQQTQLDATHFADAWRTLPDFPAYSVTGQADYCEHHKRRFSELASGMATLIEGKPGSRVLEVGVSAFSNLYCSLFPNITLHLADRPTAADYPGFTRARAEEINGCDAFFALDLNVPGALARGDLSAMSDYDLIIFTEVLPLLRANPVEILRGLFSRLAPGGYVYLTSANFLSEKGRQKVAAGFNPAPFYPPGDENWDCHHVYRNYTFRELLECVQRAGGETRGFYYSACMDGDKELAALVEDRRSTLVLAARLQQLLPEPVADSDKEVIIHIGSDKAGSTAIQTHVYGNRQWLLKQGVYVPEAYLGKDNGHAELLENVSTRKLTRLREELAAKAQNFDKVFLTWEGAHFLASESLRLLAQYLDPFKVRVIFYLREQADVIQSGLLQEIKQPRRPVNLAREAVQPQAPENRDYYQTVKRWEACFRGLVSEVVYYDRAEFPNGNVVEDLLNRLGCSDHSHFNFYRRDINSSLDVASALVLQRKQEQEDLNSEQRRNVVDSLLLNIRLQGAGQKYFLTRTQVEQLRQSYLPSNRALIEEYAVAEKLLTGARPVYIDGETNFSPTIDAEIADIEKNTAVHEQYPVCFSGYVSADELAVYLREGWGELADGGYESRGSSSRIQLRPLLQSIHPWCRWLLVKTRGRYRGGAGETTVLLNGQPLGDYDLGAATVAIPLQDLPRDLHLELELRHGRAALAYSLEALCVLTAETR